ncbi:mechanosensitive ion channel family protein [Lyngbya confervoides]|uniref:Mechanosensitive ion channel family protein n=1 Tax=Lyngbya confervoides BDU141951 TaxID=1574623 RepID=A0ABD4T6R6_9CYAN|nr:mechanosensitive ion channel family protein [Lyngbya confervoides]MCM1984408.1 mechanosensitive ion channel family protein [Lyngbya confervoides BDU141951]
MDEISITLAWEKIELMLQETIKLLPNLVIGTIIFILFWFIARFVRSFVRQLVRGRRNGRNLGLVFGRLAQWFIIILGALVALTIILPSFKPSDFLASLGIGGVAIGFAFRDVLQNFLAGILILLTEPFQLNDQIVFKDFEGTVENIETRATTIRTYDGRRVVIPNAELFTNSVTVNTAFDKRRLEYDFGIGYGDDIAQAKQIILAVLHEQEDVLTDPAPEAIVVALADFTINIRARWWINPPRQADLISANDQVLEAVCVRLAEQGIDLPFPTQQILFHDQTEETDGDRTRQREGWPVALDGSAPKARDLVKALRQRGSP